MPQMKLPAVGARISMDEDWLGSYMRVENAYWLSQMAAAQAVITEGPAEGADTCSMPRSGSDSSLADCVEKFVAKCDPRKATSPREEKPRRWRGLCLRRRQADAKE